MQLALFLNNNMGAYIALLNDNSLVKALHIKVYIVYKSITKTYIRKKVKTELQ